MPRRCSTSGASWATSTRCNLHPSQATRSRGGLGFYPACAPTPEALTSIALLPLPLELGVSRNYERLTCGNITPARQPGCQRHGRGTLWQLPSSKSASTAVIYVFFLNTRLDSHVAIMFNDHAWYYASPVNQSRAASSTARQHDRPTQRAHKIMFSWASTTSTSL